MKGLQAVRAFLADHAPDVEIVELDVGTSTQTVADRLGVLPGQVANTLVLDVKGRQVLAVTSGGTRLDNKNGHRRRCGLLRGRESAATSSRS